MKFPWEEEDVQQIVRIFDCKVISLEEVTSSDQKMGNKA